jgi:hypothetical protein
VDFEVSQRIQPELGPTERLLWAGRPVQGVVFRKADLMMVPFSLLWGGFAIFWEYSAWSSEAPPFFLLFGLPFVLIGIYLIFGRFFVNAYVRRHTYYAVSDERVLIMQEAFGKNIKSLDLKTISDVSLSQRGIDGGAIFFGPTTPFSGWSNTSWPGASRSIVPNFDLDSGARNVYEIIRGAKRDAA